jgi:hypothetical protein
MGDRTRHAGGGLSLLVAAIIADFDKDGTVVDLAAFGVEDARVGFVAGGETFCGGGAGGGVGFGETGVVDLRGGLDFVLDVLEEFVEFALDDAGDCFGGRGGN